MRCGITPKQIAEAVRVLALAGVTKIRVSGDHFGDMRSDILDAYPPIHKHKMRDDFGFYIDGVLIRAEKSKPPKPQE